jgi:hypothetical protein
VLLAAYDRLWPGPPGGRVIDLESHTPDLTARRGP